MVEARETGEADVLEVFTLTLNRKDRAVGMSKHTAVAGSRVTAGQASAGSAVRVVRGGEVTQGGGGVLSGPLGSSRVVSGHLWSSRHQVIHEGDVISLKHFKQEVRTALHFECRAAPVV